MTPNLTYVVTVGVLFAAGVTLLLERSLTRILLGVILLGNGVNLLILTGGNAGAAPIAGLAGQERMSDPLPQAMVLTAIVITLGMTAFLLAMASRTWLLTGHDEVQDDVEDRRIVRLAEQDADLPDDVDALDDINDLNSLNGVNGGDPRRTHVTEPP
ncbi:Na(+)/H(+) antiporter subunit C [Nonomuraea wenchangensis]|uniref:Na(+)/H(+) antiporter subunit C n=1 Tax=Nonomuraea wenchangensis TaxID=568860 RepID=UPI003F4DA5F7